MTLTNPYRTRPLELSREAPRAHARGLDGVISALVVPLDPHCTLPHGPVALPEPYNELFTAGHFSEYSQEVDLGKLAAVARTVIAVGGGEVTFGRSAGTFDNLLVDDHHGWLARPAVCLTAWTTSDGPVLTIERLDRRPAKLAALVSDGAVDRDVINAFQALLRGTGLTAEDDLWTLFGASSAADRSGVRKNLADLTSWCGRRIRRLFGVDSAGDRFGPRGQHPSLAELISKSVRHIRGAAVSEALLVAIAPDAGAAVEMLYSHADEDGDDHEQESGWPHTWSRFGLAGKPVEDGAASLMRDDARAVLVNLESTSYLHDYADVLMGSMVALTVPVVAARAALHRAFGAVRAAVVDPDSTKLSVRLATVATIRELLLRRDIAALTASPEQTETWSNPGLLASRLDETIAKVDHELADSLPRLVAATDTELERRLQERREKWDDRITVGGGVAVVATLVGLFAAFASLPGPASNSLLSSLPGAVVATVVGVVVGLVIGLSFLQIRKGSK